MTSNNQSCRFYDEKSIHQLIVSPILLKKKNRTEKVLLLKMLTNIYGALWPYRLSIHQTNVSVMTSYCINTPNINFKIAL